MAGPRSRRGFGAIHTQQVEVPNLGTRRVRTYVPTGYDGNRPYPLLVMFDGQNVFDDAGSFAGGWHAHQAVERLAKRRARPIVVGIDHGGGQRMMELTPWARGGRAGKADAFVGYVASSLIPDLRKRYRIVEGPAGVLVAGSSLGGLAATYAHFRFPETFGGVLAMSPSFWLGHPKIYDFVAAQSKPWTSQVYLDVGTLEMGGGGQRLVERMASILRERGYAKDRLMVRIDRRGGHNERSWRRRLPAALRFFYN